MKIAFKKTIHSTLKRCGWVIHRYQPSSDPNARLKNLLKLMSIDLIFDVGANQGQFAAGLRQLGYKGHMLSFEPLQVAHLSLEAAAHGDSLWTVMPRCAVGAENGTVNINVSENSFSSSVLPMHANLAVAAPAARFVAQESVPLLTLDHMAKPYIKNGERCMLKIDTQGYEWEVLNGASSTMKNVVAIIIEASLVPLYSGQRLWLDYVERLLGEGFVVWDIHSAFAAPKDGRLLQVDLVFVKTELA